MIEKVLSWTGVWVLFAMLLGFVKGKIGQKDQFVYGKRLFLYRKTVNHVTLGVAESTGGAGGGKESKGFRFQN